MLEESHGKEILSIRMQRKPPANVPKVPDDVYPGNNKGESATNPIPAPVLRTPAFLEWPMRDEFGEKETIEVKRRVSLFLRAVYLGLPVPNDMTRIERARYPQAVSEKRAQAIAPLSIQPTSFADLQKYIKVAPSLGTLGQELLSKAKELMRLFVPSSDGTDFDSPAIGIFWGAVSEVLQV